MVLEESPWSFDGGGGKGRSRPRRSSKEESPSRRIQAVDVTSIDMDEHTYPSTPPHSSSSRDTGKQGKSSGDSWRRSQSPRLEGTGGLILSSPPVTGGSIRRNGTQSMSTPPVMPSGVPGGRGSKPLGNRASSLAAGRGSEATSGSCSYGVLLNPILPPPPIQRDSCRAGDVEACALTDLGSNTSQYSYSATGQDGGGSAIAPTTPLSGRRIGREVDAPVTPSVGKRVGGVSSSSGMLLGSRGEDAGPEPPVTPALERRGKKDFSADFSADVSALRSGSPGAHSSPLGTLSSRRHMTPLVSTGCVDVDDNFPAISLGGSLGTSHDPAPETPGVGTPVGPGISSPPTSHRRMPHQLYTPPFAEDGWRSEPWVEDCRDRWRPPGPTYPDADEDSSSVERFPSPADDDPAHSRIGSEVWYKVVEKMRYCRRKYARKSHGGDWERDGTRRGRGMRRRRRGARGPADSGEEVRAGQCDSGCSPGSPERVTLPQSFVPIKDGLTYRRPRFYDESDILNGRLVGSSGRALVGGTSGRTPSTAASTRAELPGPETPSVMATPPHPIPPVTTPVVPRRRIPSPVFNSPLAWLTPDRERSTGVAGTNGVEERSESGSVDGCRGGSNRRGVGKQGAAVRDVGDKRERAAGDVCDGDWKPRDAIEMVEGEALCYDRNFQHSYAHHSGYDPWLLSLAPREFPWPDVQGEDESDQDYAFRGLAAAVKEDWERKYGVGKYPMELKSDGKDCLKLQHMELKDFNSLVYWSRYVYGGDGSSLLEDMYTRRRLVAEAEQNALERAAKLPAMKERVSKRVLEKERKIFLVWARFASRDRRVRELRVARQRSFTRRVLEAWRNEAVRRRRMRQLLLRYALERLRAALTVWRSRARLLAAGDEMAVSRMKKMQEKCFVAWKEAARTRARNRRVALARGMSATVSFENLSCARNVMLRWRGWSKQRRWARVLALMVQKALVRRCFATLARDQLSIRECMGRRRQVILAQAFHAFVVESKRGVEVGVGAYPPWRSTQVSRAGNGGKDGHCSHASPVKTSERRGGSPQVAREERVQRGRVLPQAGPEGAHEGESSASRSGVLVANGEMAMGLPTRRTHGVLGEAPRDENGCDASPKRDLHHCGRRMGDAWEMEAYELLAERAGFQVHRNLIRDRVKAKEKQKKQSPREVPTERELRGCVDVEIESGDSRGETDDSSKRDIEYGFRLLAKAIGSELRNDLLGRWTQGQDSDDCLQGSADSPSGKSASKEGSEGSRTKILISDGWSMTLETLRRKYVEDMIEKAKKEYGQEAVSARGEIDETTPRGSPEKKSGVEDSDVLGYGQWSFDNPYDSSLEGRTELSVQERRELFRKKMMVSGSGESWDPMNSQTPGKDSCPIVSPERTWRSRRRRDAVAGENPGSDPGPETPHNMFQKSSCAAPRGGLRTLLDPPPTKGDPWNKVCFDEERVTRKGASDARGSREQFRDWKWHSMESSVKAGHSFVRDAYRRTAMEKGGGGHMAAEEHMGGVRERFEQTSASSGTGKETRETSRGKGEGHKEWGKILASEAIVGRPGEGLKTEQSSGQFADESCGAASRDAARGSADLRARTRARVVSALDSAASDPEVCARDKKEELRHGQVSAKAERPVVRLMGSAWPELGKAYSGGEGPVERSAPGEAGGEETWGDSTVEPDVDPQTWRPRPGQGMRDRNRSYGSAIPASDNANSRDASSGLRVPSESPERSWRREASAMTGYPSVRHAISRDGCQARWGDGESDKRGHQVCGEIRGRDSGIRATATEPSLRRGSGMSVVEKTDVGSSKSCDELRNRSVADVLGFGMKFLHTCGEDDGGAAGGSPSNLPESWGRRLSGAGESQMVEGDALHDECWVRPALDATGTRDRPDPEETNEWNFDDFTLAEEFTGRESRVAKGEALLGLSGPSRTEWRGRSIPVRTSPSRASPILGWSSGKNAGGRVSSSGASHTGAAGLDAGEGAGSLDHATLADDQRGRPGSEVPVSGDSSMSSWDHGREARARCSSAGTPELWGSVVGSSDIPGVDKGVSRSGHCRRSAAEVPGSGSHSMYRWSHGGEPSARIPVRETLQGWGNGSHVVPSAAFGGDKGMPRDDHLRRSVADLPGIGGSSMGGLAQAEDPSMRRSCTDASQKWDGVIAAVGGVREGNPGAAQSDPCRRTAPYMAELGSNPTLGWGHSEEGSKARSSTPPSQGWGGFPRKENPDVDHGVSCNHPRRRPFSEAPLFGSSPSRSWSQSKDTNVRSISIESSQRCPSTVGSAQVEGAYQGASLSEHRRRPSTETCGAVRPVIRGHASSECPGASFAGDEVGQRRGNRPPSSSAFNSYLPRWHEDAPCEMEGRHTNRISRNFPGSLVNGKITSTPPGDTVLTKSPMELMRDQQLGEEDLEAESSAVMRPSNPWSARENGMVEVGSNAGGDAINGRSKVEDDNSGSEPSADSHSLLTPSAFLGSSSTVRADADDKSPASASRDEKNE